MSSVTPIISLEDLTVRYGDDARSVWALRGVSLDISAGEFVSITGPSGSGKTTLLNAIAGLEIPTSGDVVVDGHSLRALSESALARMRRTTVGYVFQFFGLLPMLDARDNVAVPLRAEGLGRSEIEDRVGRALAAVGMSQRARHYPDELSGGEMQRVAIARVLATEARILLADEPTGNLDRARGEDVLELLRSTCRDHGRTVVLVTHDLLAAAHADRIITLRDGQIENDVRAGESTENVVELPTRPRQPIDDE